MRLRAAELPAIVRQNGSHRNILFPVKRQRLVVENSYGTFRYFAGVEKAEGKGTAGINHSVEINPAYALERAHKKSVLSQ